MSLPAGWEESSAKRRPGRAELNVATWLGPEADNATRDLVREMQRRAFDIQLPADAWPEPPEPQRVTPT